MEVARQVAEKEEEEEEEKLKERERKREEIVAAECELAARKRALLEVERALDDRDDNEPNNNIRSQSFVAESNVSFKLVVVYCTNMRFYQVAPKRRSKCQLDEEAWARLEQLVHPTVSAPPSYMIPANCVIAM